jgi:hypothetical protein
MRGCSPIFSFDNPANSFFLALPLPPPLPCCFLTFPCRYFFFHFQSPCKHELQISELLRRSPAIITNFAHRPSNENDPSLRTSFLTSFPFLPVRSVKSTRDTFVPARFLAWENIFLLFIFSRAFCFGFYETAAFHPNDVCARVSINSYKRILAPSTSTYFSDYKDYKGERVSFLF